LSSSFISMTEIPMDRLKARAGTPLRTKVLAEPSERRFELACNAQQDAPASARLIEGGLPTERLVADVAVAKYADHCPLYRQAQILARQGITIDRATLAFWVGCLAAEIKPTPPERRVGVGPACRELHPHHRRHATDTSARRRCAPALPPKVSDPKDFPLEGGKVGAQNRLRVLVDLDI
jgi:hypothetical protein